MRYLIAFLVLALAVPAIVHGACPSDKELLADYDSELPVYGQLYGISNCDSLSWTFAFTRTSETDEWTIVIPNVVGTTARQEVDSRHYPDPGPDQVNGRDSVTSSPNRLRIDIKKGSSTGHFEAMDYDVHYFTP